jgi:pyruvate,water dikinase
MPNAQSCAYIVELDSLQALDSSIVGGKTSSIADLIKQGANVPSGFAIPATAFAEFIVPAISEIENLLTDVDLENPTSVGEISNAIVKKLKKHPTPPALVEAITQRVGTSPSKNLAVRSSATAEDLAGQSFAGMYETFMDPTDAESVIQRIRDVWNSYYSARAISYREHQNIPHESGLMAILVMEFINADAGGVVFTRNPRDGADQILINVGLGLGEGVVTGNAPSDSFVLTPNGSEITARNVIDKEWMFTSPTAGDLDLVPVPAAIRSAPALTDEQILAIATAATKIKQSAGDDRDIEFAVKDNIVHILQSRPITTGNSEEADFPVEWDGPEEEKLHWVGNRKAPAWPLMIDYAIMQGVAEKRSADFTGQNMGQYDLKKLVNGWMFAGKSPRDPEETERTLRKYHRNGLRLLKKGTTYFAEVIEPKLRSNLAQLESTRPANQAPTSEHVAYMRNAMALTTNHMNDLHWRGPAGFEKAHKNLSKAFADITGRPAIEASDTLLAIEHMTARLTRRIVGMAALVKSDNWLTSVFERRDYPALFARGNGNKPAVKKFRNRFRSMMEIWGCRNGLGYGSAWIPTDPTWNMKPSIPLDLIGSYLRQDIPDAGRLHANLVKKRTALIKEVHDKIGSDKKKRKNFDFELFRETTRIQFMENHNYLIEQRSNGEFREAINRLGISLTERGYIDEPDDVFFLRLSQLDEASNAENYSGLNALVLRAKEDRAIAQKLTPPEFLGTKPPDDDKDEEEMPLRGISDDGETLHGEASSNGTFTGTARVVITRTSTPPDINKGDILVTENTGPDWVPVFPLLGGLVLDGGDNHQHASLIAREYGIPCVIQTKEATTKITNGQLVQINGTTGIVTLNPTT